MKNCSQCDGYGSLESLDHEEMVRGIRDTCYRCGGSGRVSDEAAKDEEIERAGAFLASLLAKGQPNDYDADAATLRLRFLPEEAREVILAWVPLAMEENRLRMEVARRARVLREKAEWSRNRAASAMRYKAHFHFRGNDPDYIPF